MPDSIQTFVVDTIVRWARRQIKPDSPPSPHPHAALLFVDFMLSPAAQKIYSEELGYSSLRRDMVSPAAPAQTWIEKGIQWVKPTSKRDSGAVSPRTILRASQAFHATKAAMSA